MTAPMDLEKEAAPRFTTRRSLFLASLIVLAFFGTVEIVLRLSGVRPPVRPQILLRQIDVDITFPFMQPDRDLFWSPRPGFHGEFEGKPVSINSLGLRGDEVTVPKPRGRRRVATFGDSITFGYGVGDEDTYAARLGQALGGRIEVVNCGVTGYTSHQVLRLLRRVGPVLTPDVATFCIGWNDASRRPVDDRTYAASLRLAFDVEGFFDHLYLYRGIKNLYVRSQTREWSAPPRGPRVPLAQYRENLEAIVKECRARGIQAVFVDLPRRRKAGEAPFESGYSTELREVANALSVPVFDPGDLGLKTSLPTNEEHFIDTFTFHRFRACLPCGRARPAARGEAHPLKARDAGVNSTLRLLITR